MQRLHVLPDFYLDLEEVDKLLLAKHIILALDTERSETAYEPRVTPCSEFWPLHLLACHQ